MLKVKETIKLAERELAPCFEQAEETAYRNQVKVLDAFRALRIRELHFHPSSGYGYSDAGREAFEDLFSQIFDTEDALVRPQLVSGTHAIASSMLALLRPGDELLSAAGAPYDTLGNVIKGPGASMASRGILYRQADLTPQGSFNPDAIYRSLTRHTRLVLIQRSRGYQLRPALGLADIKAIIDIVKRYDREIIILVDNCYGEFVCSQEPSQLGADLLAGSLIKNPGGGMAANGGYVCGPSNLIEQIAWHLTAPGLGKELGSIPYDKRYLFMGLFNAPHIVLQALKGAMLLAYVFEAAGFEVSPGWKQQRSDIVQAVRLGDAEQVKRFCQIVQRHSPVDSDVSLEYGTLPGYTDGVVMAAGTFIQGSSIELSCDAPLREPYCAFFQGGLNYQHIRYVVDQLLREFSA